VGVGEQVRIVNEPHLLGRLNGELYLESHPSLEEDTITTDERLAALFASARNESGAFIDEGEQQHARAAANAALGVPVRVLLGDSNEMWSRVRVVRNTVEPDPDMPTLAEVRELLDAPAETETSAGGAVAPSGGPAEADLHN
jgi:uncharacterized protein YfiM (DUF2279 family)